MEEANERREDIFSDEPRRGIDDEDYVSADDPFSEVPEFPVNKINGEEIECELWQFDGLSELRTNGLLRGEDGIYKTEIKSLDDVDYVLQRISNYEERVRQTAATYDKRISQLEAQIYSLKVNKSDAMAVWGKRSGFFRSLFTIPIQEFVSKFIGQSDVRSIKLPTGKVGWRITQRESWNITDNDVVLSVLREFNPSAIKESILVSKLPKTSEKMESLLNMVEGDVNAYEKLCSAMDISERVDSFYLEAGE